MLQTLRKYQPVLAKIKKPGKNMFWAWITYQVVKGTLTTTFIWVPLIYAWAHVNHG
jgi:hypothetical protein